MQPGSSSGSAFSRSSDCRNGGQKVSKRSRTNDWGREILAVEQKKLQILSEKRENSAQSTPTLLEDNDLNFFKTLLPHMKNLDAEQKLMYQKSLLDITLKFVRKQKEINENAQLYVTVLK